MATVLPPTPHLDHLKKQAKDLLKSFQSGDSQTCASVQQYLPRFSRLSPDGFTLHDAQHAIARQYVMDEVWRETFFAGRAEHQEDPTVTRRQQAWFVHVAQGGNFFVLGPVGVLWGFDGLTRVKIEPTHPPRQTNKTVILIAMTCRICVVWLIEGW